MNATFFTYNRQAIAEKLDGGLVVLTAYTRMQRQNDAAHAFDQEANFWYLAGIDEPDWQLIVDGMQHKSWLIAPDISDVHRVFDGSLDETEAKVVSGVDAVVSFDEGQRLLRQLAKKHSVVWSVEHPRYAHSFNFALNPQITKHLASLERTFGKVRSCNKELAELRAIKQPEEIVAIKKAIAVTADAFRQVHDTIASYTYEYEIEAAFTQYFRSHAAQGHAYDPIVASGKNACTLHYAKNAQRVKRQQLILMDVGARINGYAADITRTYAKTSATKRQIAVHRAVEEAHHAIIDLIRPTMTVDAYHEAVMKIMTEAIASLGLIHKGSDDDAVRRYFPHAVSHGLGIDVHDSLAGPRYFKENMVLTVEPGIYIPEEGIGVRIEDDVLVTAGGHTNLSARLSTGL